MPTTPTPAFTPAAHSACTNCGLIFDAGPKPRHPVYAAGPRGPVCSMTCLVIEQTKAAYTATHTPPHPKAQEQERETVRPRVDGANGTDRSPPPQEPPVLDGGRGQPVRAVDLRSDPHVPVWDAIAPLTPSAVSPGHRLSFTEHARIVAQNLTVEEAKDISSRFLARWPEMQSYFACLTHEGARADRNRSNLHARAEHIATGARELAEEALRVRDGHVARLDALTQQHEDDLAGADLVAAENARKTYREMKNQRDEARAERDAAYAERALIVAALAHSYRLDPAGRAWRGIDVNGETGFQTVCFIELPTGQVSWHFADADTHLLKGLPESDRPWDGHTTEEKHRRLNALLITRPWQ